MKGCATIKWWQAGQQLAPWVINWFAWSWEKSFHGQTQQGTEGLREAKQETCTKVCASLKHQWHKPALGTRVNVNRHAPLSPQFPRYWFGAGFCCMVSSLNSSFTSSARERVLQISPITYITFSPSWFALLPALNSCMSWAQGKDVSLKTELPMYRGLCEYRLLVDQFWSAVWN